MMVHRMLKVKDFIYLTNKLRFQDSPMIYFFIIAVGSTRCLSCQADLQNKTRYID